MRQLNRALLTLAFWVGVGCLTYLGYQARLTYLGYCHAADKFLSNDEKINAAIEELLKKYPAAVVRTSMEPNVSSLSVPIKPVHYSNPNQFLSMNPNCCKVKPTSTYMEGGRLSLVQILTGTATNVVEINYLVRFKDEQDKPQAIKTTAYLHTNNCGAPGRPWSPTD